VVANLPDAVSKLLPSDENRVQHVKARTKYSEIAYLTQPDAQRKRRNLSEYV